MTTTITGPVPRSPNGSPIEGRPWLPMSRGPAPTAGGRLMTATGLVFGFVLCAAWLRTARADVVLANHARGVNGLRETPAHRDYLKALRQALSADAASLTAPSYSCPMAKAFLDTPALGPPFIPGPPPHLGQRCSAQAP